MKKASAYGAIKEKIEKSGGDRLWTHSDFPGRSPMAVAVALSRLCKAGIISRVRKGVYYLPRETSFGPSRPDPRKVAVAVLRDRGLRPIEGGLAGFNDLGLTTQVSPATTLLVDRRTSVSKTAPGWKVRVRYSNNIRGLSPKERILLDALRNIRSVPDARPEETLVRVAEIFRSGDASFERVVKRSRKEPPRVRALLGTIGSIIGADSGLLGWLRQSLNPFTRFNLGIAEAVPEARNWRIR